MVWVASLNFSAYFIPIPVLHKPQIGLYSFSLPLFLTNIAKDPVFGNRAQYSVVWEVRPSEEVHPRSYRFDEHFTRMELQTKTKLKVSTYLKKSCFQLFLII